MKVSPFNPPAAPMIMFKVTFGHIRFGRPTSSTLYLQSHSARSLKRRIYSTIDSVQSLSIVPVAVKN